MIKKILISTAAILILGGCNAAQLTEVASGALSNATAPSTTTAKSVSTNGALPAGCIPRNGGGSTSFTQMVTEKLVSIAINSALESTVGDNNIKAPAKIMDTCTADKRLAYVKTLTDKFAGYIDQANKDILASVEQTKEVQKLQEEIAHKEKTLEEAEYNEGVTKDNAKTLELIENATIVDKKKYSEAMGKLAIATPTIGYVIVGWDKEILEFAKDNMVWGVSNVGSVTDVGSQLMTTMEVLPALASLTTSPLYDGKVDEDVAKKAAEKSIKEAKEVEAAAAAENGFDD